MSLGERAGRALAWNAGSLVAARVISLVRFLVLARLLAPEDFGLLAIAWAAVELLLVATDTGVATALLQRRDVDARHYDTAWTLRLGRTVLVAAVLVPSAPLIAELYGEPRAAPVLQALALAPVLSAAASIGTAELSRRLEYRRLGLLRLAETGTEAVVSIALAPALGVWGLVVGVLAANVVRIAVSYAVAPHRPRVLVDRAAATSLLGFGRWMFLTGVFVLAGDAVLRAVVSRRLGTAELGALYLALRLALLPLSAAEAAVGAVAVRAHAEADDAARARGLQTSLVALLAVLAPGYAVLAVLAPSLVDLLGEQWAGAAGPLQLLAAGCTLAVVGTVVLPMVVGAGRPQVSAAVTGARAVLLCAAALALAGPWGLVGAGAAVLLAEALAAAAWCWTARGALLRRGPLGSQLLVVAAASVVAAGVAAGLDRRLPGAAGTVVGGLLAGAAAAGTLLGLSRRFPPGVLPAVEALAPGLAARLRRR